MAHWLFLPNDVMEDLAALTSFEPRKLAALRTVLDSADFQLRYSSFVKVADLLGVSDEAAARVCTFLDYLRSQRVRNKRQAQEVIEELQRFLKRKAEEPDYAKTATQASRFLAENQAEFVNLFADAPEYEHGEKVRGLEGGPLPHLDGFKAYCDLRPVYDASADKLVSCFPVITLRLLTHSTLSHTSKEILVQLTEGDIGDIKAEFDRLEKKLAKLKEEFSTAIR
jgi:hypothetical protein